MQLTYSELRISINLSNFWSLTQYRFIGNLYYHSKTSSRSFFTTITIRIDWNLTFSEYYSLISINDCKSTGRDDSGNKKWHYKLSITIQHSNITVLIRSSPYGKKLYVRRSSRTWFRTYLYKFCYTATENNIKVAKLRWKSLLKHSCNHKLN